MVPPEESSSFIQLSRYSDAFLAHSMLGIYRLFWKIQERSVSSSGMQKAPIDRVYAVSRIPREASSFEAMAPAATRPMVSRPEERPPPL